MAASGHPPKPPPKTPPRGVTSAPNLGPRTQAWTRPQLPLHARSSMSPAHAGMTQNHRERNRPPIPACAGKGDRAPASRPGPFPLHKQGPTREGEPLLVWPNGDNPAQRADEVLAIWGSKGGRTAEDYRTGRRREATADSARPSTSRAPGRSWRVTTEASTASDSRSSSTSSGK